jgi:hypothetical protein
LGRSFHVCGVDQQQRRERSDRLTVQVNQALTVPVEQAQRRGYQQTKLLSSRIKLVEESLSKGEKGQALMPKLRVW